MTYLTHVTLTTGHARRSWLHEVSPDTLESTRDLLADAIEYGGHTPMPMPGYTLLVTGQFGRGALVATVSRTGDGAPLLSFGVAPRGRYGPRLWSMLGKLHDGAWPRSFLQMNRPQAPWCAAVPLPAINSDPALVWIADFERCVAWAWIKKGNLND